MSILDLPVLPVDPSDTSRSVWVLTVEAPGVGLVHWTSAFAPDGAGLPGIVGPGSLDGDELRDRIGSEEGGEGFEVSWPPADGWPDLASIEAGGHTLAGSPAELALVSESGWSRRRVVLHGTVTAPTYGQAGEPVGFSVEVDQVDGASLGRELPDPSKHVVTEAVLGSGYSVPDDTEVFYPLVFGAPGVLQDEDGGVELWPGTPAPIVSRSLAGGVVKASTLMAVLGEPVGYPTAEATLFRTSPDTAEVLQVGVYDVDVDTDASGAVLGVIDLSGETDAIRQSAPYFLSWSASGGQRPVQASDARAGWGLATLFLDLARRCGVRVDSARMVSAIPVLDSFVLDTFLEVPTRLVPWLEDHVLAKFPVELEQGPAGLWLRPIVWKARATDAVASLVGVSRLETGGAVSVESPSDPSLGAVRVRFARRADNGAFLREALVSPSGAFMAPGSPVQGNTYEADLGDVWRSGTAFEVARYLAWREGRSHRSVSYRLDVASWHWLEAGDVVLITDAVLSLDEAVAVVTSIGRTDAPWARVDLRLA